MHLQTNLHTLNDKLTFRWVGGGATNLSLRIRNTHKPTVYVKIVALKRGGRRCFSLVIIMLRVHNKNQFGDATSIKTGRTLLMFLTKWQIVKITEFF